jgi:hypothetical protein
VVIDAELSKENHDLIFHNCDRDGLKPLDPITDLKQIKLVVIEKKNLKKVYVKIHLSHLTFFI